MNNLRFVQDVSSDMRGKGVGYRKVHHYRFDEPVKVFSSTYLYEEDTIEVKDVIISAVNAAFDTGRPETMIFKANEDGEVESWRDLENYPEFDIEGAISSFLKHNNLEED